MSSPSTQSISLFSPSNSDERLRANADTRNPITSRLYKILGTSYDDDAIRDALNNVSEFYRSSEGPYAPSGKGKQVDRKYQEDGTDFKASNDKISLSGLNNPPGHDRTWLAGTAARARKNLRRDVELKISESSHKFLEAFRDVDNKLDLLQEQVQSMRERCDEAKAQLKSTDDACRSLVERAGGLRNLRQAVSEKQAVIDAFLSHFTLSTDEINAIESREVPIGSDFFKAMEKALKIREDCRVLMAGEEGPTKAGVDIMTATSQHLEKGYEKIARWCSLEFRQLGRESQLEVTPNMKESVRWLKKRDELLNEVLQILSQTRQATLLSMFMDALTRGGPNGLPRPIEIHAHDPLRYVGDMLAWVHQAIAGEREFLDSLFGRTGDRRMVGSIRKFEDTDEEEWVRELMDNAFERLSSPLKVRVRQTFYNLTMRRTLGEAALLSKALDELTEEAYKAFFDTVDAQGRNLARTLAPNDDNMEPPLALLDHTQVLREILSVYSSSLLGDESEDEQRAGFQPILDKMVDGALELCHNVAADRQTQEATWNRDVFMINCLSHLQNILSPYSFASYKVVHLDNELDVLVANLIDAQFHKLLKDAQLDECASVCNDKSTNEPVSRVGAMRPAPLEKSLQGFSEWLSSPDVVQPLSLLSEQRLNSKVNREALKRIATTYEKICAEVRKPFNKYEAANTLMGSQRPFGQMSTLWHILGLEEDGTST